MMNTIIALAVALNLHLPPINSYQTEYRVGCLTWQHDSHIAALNEISIKDINCTFAELIVSLNRRNRFAVTGKIVYLKAW